MRNYLILSLLLPLVIAAQCNNTPPQPPPPPAPLADAAPDAAPLPPMGPTGRVCQSIHDAGCAEGESVPNCIAVVQHALDSKLTNVPINCLLAAQGQGKAAIRACSFVACP